ncbi:PREDICTED: SH3-containing GRB2-like protein 3-interacting protein 1 [Tinamus guttatus]|uniref:SH3-containing GRB2-like protein 3-interacting protein 1 n=1 Tax=Tinamus guttatus TaxID=94827 RepID=UPI00052F2643|nr:PREDICTED: SH3-containing GRB2-like protein 3-interacting protein 1 [Tinamus guttatus]
MGRSAGWQELALEEVRNGTWSRGRDRARRSIGSSTRLKKRTRKAFGIRKKEKDTDSTGSPDRDGIARGGTAAAPVALALTWDVFSSRVPQKKSNGAPNGFYAEIDWDRYNSPELDEEGYSIRPEEPGSTKGKHFYSSSESEEEEEAHKKFNIKIKPLQAKDVLKSAATVDELKASIGNIALSPSPVRKSPRRSPGTIKRNLSTPLDQPEIWGSAPPGSSGTESPKLPRPFPTGSSDVGAAEGPAEQAPSINDLDRIFGPVLSPKAAVLGSIRRSSSPPHSLAPNRLGQDAFSKSLANAAASHATEKHPVLHRPMWSLENEQPSLVWFDRGKFYLTFEAPPPAVLTFRVLNYDRLEHVLPNPQLLCCDAAPAAAGTKEFWVNMPNLMAHLKKVSEQKPQATYYNVDMLKYQVSAQGIQSTPLNLAVSWRCDPASTDLRIDYKYNTEAMTTPVALNNVQFLVPVDGGVTKLQAVLPPAVWNAEQQRILWKIPDISQNIYF